MNKVTKLFVAFVLVALLATACAAPAATATQAPATEVPATAVPATEVPATMSICGDAKAGDTLNVMYQWSGAEEEKFNSIVKTFVDECGVKIVAESTRDAAVLDTKVKSTPPDILFWPTTSPLNLYPDKLVDLKTLGAATDNYASYWLDLGSVDGKLFALPVKADIKSIIWYSPARFEALGYTVPTTFDELNTLVEKMVADGNVPWSMGFGSDAATGWTGSDFIQDLLLTQQGPQYVMDIINGNVKYNDAGVVQAYETYQKWSSDAKYTVGGADGTVNTPFLDAIYKVFQPEPEAMMVKQSGFAGGEIVKQFPDLQYGTDYDFFAFPGIQGMQGGADYMMAFSDSAAAKALVAYLTSAEGASAWAKAGFDLSPNNKATDQYTDAQLTKKAAALANATGFTPDLGDTLPAPFGENEWKAIIAVVQGGSIQTALDAVVTATAQ
ncbi:MAG: extracellular solute-binding protein [Anaerolineaceae bacterium]|nr:extracellular solute-binding protein [Anaerolineaceae bacterium]